METDLCSVTRFFACCTKYRLFWMCFFANTLHVLCAAVQLCACACKRVCVWVCIPLLCCWLLGLLPSTWSPGVRVNKCIPCVSLRARAFMFLLCPFWECLHETLASVRGCSLTSVHCVLFCLISLHLSIWERSMCVRVCVFDLDINGWRCLHSVILRIHIFIPLICSLCQQWLRQEYHCTLIAFV